MIRRRAFISALGVAPMWPLAARAQQAALPRLGAIRLTEPGGKPVYINVALLTFVKPDSHIAGASVELGLTSGRVQGVQEDIEEIIRLVRASHRGELTWIKLTEPNGKVIYINVSQVTAVRSDSRIPGANAELGFASGKLQGVRETSDEVMQLVATLAAQAGKLP